jgi:hypothetical protein
VNGRCEREEEFVRVENPFATRFTRPGALPFLFDEHESAAAMVASFVAAGRRGAIVGPHGSGKSTLLVELLPEFIAMGMQPIVHTLHDGQRRLTARFAQAISRVDGTPLLVIDGYEQLSWWGRREVGQAVKRSGAGLLVTSHAPPAGLPTLFSTRPTWETTRRVIAKLAPSLPAATISEDELRRLYEQCGRNLRELLFQLYDRFESHRS